jgi:hypothetical protein
MAGRGGTGAVALNAAQTSGVLLQPTARAASTSP